MTATAAGAKTRLVALDVFRGATIFLMILVNTAGPGAAPYPQLVHARWIGFTLADLVFPTFLFAMGTAMSLARRRPVPAGTYYARLARRAAIIFALGVLMYWFPFVVRDEAGWAPIPFSATRLPGVLQRLALCYLFAGILVRQTGLRGLAVAAVVLLAGHWLILLGFSPAGLAYDKLANAGTRLDLWLLGADHLYRKDGGFDPEGLLGTLPATVNVLAGYAAGRALTSGAPLRAAATRMAMAGLVLIPVSLAWAPLFPIAKKLWTGPFVLLTTGLDLILLAALVMLVEVVGMRRGTRFFAILGRNPLAIYLFSELLVIVLALIPAPPHRGLYAWVGIELFQRMAPGPLGSLLCALAYTMVCWAVGWWLDRRGLILRA